MKIRSRTILLAFLALLLSACAATKKPEPVEIQIQTAPPGALVDWNGNVLGIAPWIVWRAMVARSFTRTLLK